MILKIFTIYDSKANSFLQPFYCPNQSVAIRHFAHAANDPSTDIGRYPEDFNLHEIGTFDTDSGDLAITTPAISHGMAIQFKER